ncbi:MAG: iron-containing alcohol dehydrogenase [Chloroflexota bacterium]|nr:iron-containing alcohol dehydrogenase [Chloroflexota bacterium]
MASSAGFIIDPHGACFFGAGTVAQLPELVGSLPARRVFLVTDRGVAGAGISVAVERSLRRAGIEVAVFDGIQPNPDITTLDAGAAAIRSFGPGAVLALGGGAVLDVAKGLALMAVNKGTARDVEYSRHPDCPGLPVIAVPTTAGTGSETNAWGVIDDPAAGRKIYIGHQSVAPRFVVLDPALTLTLPPAATAAAGMDALCHALESLSSVRGNLYAECLDLQVVRLVSRSLPRAIADGKDLAARSDLLLAAHLAGLAFATTGLGLAHAVGHALSARLGAAHGVALSVLLPPVLAFNLPARQALYARLAPVLESAETDANERAQAEATIEAVRQLGADLGLPGRLGDLGCRASHIPSIVEDALADEVMSNTPRPPTAEELASLLLAIL